MFSFFLAKLKCFHFREDSKVSHYIINKTQQKNQPRYKIGDNFFNTLPELLSFYKVHYLDTTPLIRPASKKVEKVIGKFDFEGTVSEDFYINYFQVTYSLTEIFLIERSYEIMKTILWYFEFSNLVKY